MASASAKGSPIGWLAFNQADRMGREMNTKKDDYTRVHLSRDTSLLYSTISEKLEDHPRAKKRFGVLWKEAEEIEQAGVENEWETMEDVLWSAALKRYEACMAAGIRAGLFDELEMEKRDFWGRPMEKGTNQS